MMWKPRIHSSADHYPYDFDGSERQTRFPTGVDKFPVQSMIGCVSGFMPQLTRFMLAQHYAKVPSGPGSTAYPLNLQWQIVIPGLNKQQGMASQ